MKPYLLGIVGTIILSLSSVCSAFEYSFDGWEDQPGKVIENGKETWPHKTKTVKFQKAYNEALEKAHKNQNCVEQKPLAEDFEYGELTHTAREFVSSGRFTEICEKAWSSLPPVPNGSLLPGPSRGEDAKSYVMEKFLPGLTNWILVAITAASVVMGVIAGMFYIFSSGDSEMTKRGKDILVWTILGFTIAALSFTVVKFIININFI